MLEIGIFCSDTGWIYDQFIAAFEKYSKHKIIRNPKCECDVYYYIPYYELPKEKHIQRPSCSWMSHQESKSPLKEKFVSAAKQSDMAISHSKKYADILKNEYGIDNVIQIIPGVDLEKYKLRSTKRQDNRKLIVGYSGRTYQSSNRKNPGLLKQISELPFVEFRTTGGKMNLDDLPKFYSDCDIIVQPSLIEGGSMSVQESLAVGVPIMCFEDVGVAQEFSIGVIKVDKNDKINDFASRLNVLHRGKNYMHYRDSGVMKQMRNQVKDQSFERFAIRHDKVWEALV